MNLTFLSSESRSWYVRNFADATEMYSISMPMKLPNFGKQICQNRRRCFLFALALTVVGCAPVHNTGSNHCPASVAPPNRTVLITIVVLNGANGRPVWREAPNIWVDHEPPINPRTDLLGKTKIKISESADQIMISPNWGHECRGGDNPQARTNIRYSVAEILRSGVVTLNLCGKSTGTPKPGVLVFYERPSTFKEIWNE